MKPVIIFCSKWGVVGAFIAVLWLLFWSLTEKSLIQNWNDVWYALHIAEAITWPFSILPVGDILSTASKYIVLAQMVFANFALYAVVAGIYCFLFKRSKVV